MLLTVVSNTPTETPFALMETFDDFVLPLGTLYPITLPEGSEPVDGSEDSCVSSCEGTVGFIEPLSNSPAAASASDFELYFFSVLPLYTM